MGNGKFIAGLFVGAAIGVAGKILYDNREEVLETLIEQSEIARYELANMVEYASERVSQFSDKSACTCDDCMDEVAEEVAEIAEDVKDAIQA